MIEIGTMVTVLMPNGHRQGKVKKIFPNGKQLTGETTYEVHGRGFITVASKNAITDIEPPMNTPVIVYGDSWWSVAEAVPYKKPWRHKSPWRWMGVGPLGQKVHYVDRWEPFNGDCKCSRCPMNKCLKCVASSHERASCDYLHKKRKNRGIN